MMNKQVVSKERVAGYGEVYTNELEVKAMLNLQGVKKESYRVDSRFLEPSCGHGNFLVEILKRKLLNASNKKDVITAVSSIYGIDILIDNVELARERLLAIVIDNLYFSADDLELVAMINDVLSKNIVWGDALTMTRQDNKKAIEFYEWTWQDAKLQGKKSSMKNDSKQFVANKLDF